MFNKSMQQWKRRNDQVRDLRIINLQKQIFNDRSEKKNGHNNEQIGDLNGSLPTFSVKGQIKKR